MSYANPRHAKGLCDVCGFTAPLSSLRMQTENGRATGLKVCADCFDLDDRRPGLRRPPDAEDLRDPRPDGDPSTYRGLYGWNPVGHPSLKAKASIGFVRVVISSED